MPLAASRGAISYMGGGGAGANTVQSLTYQASAESSTSGTYTITIPAGSQTGDIAFLFDRINTQTTTNTTPTGWTNITTYNSPGTHKWTLSYKILVSGDAGSSITGQSASTTVAHRKLMLVYRPNWSIGTVTIGDLAQDATSSGTSVPDQTLSMTSLVEPGIGFAFYAFGTTGTLTRGSTVSTDGQGTVQEYTQGSVLYVKTFVWDSNDSAGDSTISIAAASAQQMGLFTFYAQLT